MTNEKNIRSLIEGKRDELRNALREASKDSMYNPHLYFNVYFWEDGTVDTLTESDGSWGYISNEAHLVATYNDSTGSYYDSIVGSWTLERWEEKVTEYGSPEDREKYDEWKAAEIDEYGYIEIGEVVDWISDNADHIGDEIREECVNYLLNEEDYDGVIDSFVSSFEE